MHSAEHHGFWFNYNGDYSGLIHITDIFDHESVATFAEIKRLAFSSHFRNPVFNEAYREFVATAAINAGISLLEQMETEEVLANPWLRNVLMDMTSKGNND